MTIGHSLENGPEVQTSASATAAALWRAAGHGGGSEDRWGGGGPEDNEEEINVDQVDDLNSIKEETETSDVSFLTINTQYSKSLSNYFPLSFYATQIINPFLNSIILANHKKF